MRVDILNTNKKYEIIYADPPWQYKDRGCSGACEKHYKTMKLEEIKNLPIAKIASKDCVLFLWTTYPQLKQAGNGVTVNVVYEIAKRMEEKED